MRFLLFFCCSCFSVIPRKPLLNSRSWKFTPMSSKSVEVQSSPHHFFPPFWPCCSACWILVPQPGIEPGSLAVKARSPSHGTSREAPQQPFWGTVLSSLAWAACPQSPVTGKGSCPGSRVYSIGLCARPPLLPRCLDDKSFVVSFGISKCGSPF